MKPLTTGDRDDMLRKRDVTTPLKVTLDVYSGHDQSRELEEKDKKASVTLLRSYMGPGVTRCFVEEYGFYGTLFLPPGDGPFPGIRHSFVVIILSATIDPRRKQGTPGICKKNVNQQEA